MVRQAPGAHEPLSACCILAPEGDSGIAVDSGESVTVRARDTLETNLLPAADHAPRIISIECEWKCSDDREMYHHWNPKLRHLFSKDAFLRQNTVCKMGTGG